MEQREYGFVAFWKATDSWFEADEDTRRHFMIQIQEVMDEARQKGIQTFGNYDCCWSSEWRYFTFWLCPDIELLEKTMKQLVEIGDINHFNIQHHYVGRRTLEDLVQ